MRDRLTRCLLFAAGALACAAAPAQEPAAAPLPRTCAEWEPALGTADGAAVEYSIHAQDESGRVATMPPSAPAGFYTIPAAGDPAHEKG